MTNEHVRTARRRSRGCSFAPSAISSFSLLRRGSCGRYSGAVWCRLCDHRTRRCRTRKRAQRRKNDGRDASLLGDRRGRHPRKRSSHSRSGRGRSDRVRRHSRRRAKNERTTNRRSRHRRGFLAQSTGREAFGLRYRRSFPSTRDVFFDWAEHLGNRRKQHARTFQRPRRGKRDER